MSPVNPGPRRPAGTRTWLVPAVSARTTWGVPAVGTNPLPPAVRRPPDDDTATARRPDETGRRSWRVPAAGTGETPAVPTTGGARVVTTGGTPAIDDLRAWSVPSSMAQTTWRVPAVTGPTPVVGPGGPEDWRATTPITGRQRAVEVPSVEVPAVDVPAPLVDVPPFEAPPPFPEGLASSQGGTRLTDAWRPAAPAPRPTGVQPDERSPVPEPTTPPPAPEARARCERSELEHGDRELFLALARQRLARGVPVNAVHPPAAPPPGTSPGYAPEPAYTNVIADDLLGTFARSVEEAGAVCHLVEGEIPETLLDHIVAELGGWEAVVSAESEAAALGHSLAVRGVEVRAATPETAARATLGVTSAVAGIAATGSVVLDSRQAGGRLASLLPPVHICLLPADRIVAAPADVLRGLGHDPGALPSSLVLVTGPSRTGDIEQLLTIGAHGPTALHVIVVSPAP